MAVVPTLAPSPLPTLPGFIAWVRTAMGVPVAALADDSVWFVYAFNVAVSVVATEFACVPGPIYMLMVYNLGGDNLVNFSQDSVPPYPYPDHNPDDLGYFTFLRQQWKLTNFVAGVVESASDQGTSDSLAVPDALKNLTLSQLQNLKTPWGRQYFAWAMDFGQTWGLS